MQIWKFPQFFGALVRLLSGLDIRVDLELFTIGIVVRRVPADRLQILPTRDTTEFIPDRTLDGTLTFPPQIVELTYFTNRKSISNPARQSQRFRPRSSSYSLQFEPVAFPFPRFRPQSKFYDRTSSVTHIHSTL